jgi:hypothetical protein
MRKVIADEGLNSWNLYVEQLVTMRIDTMIWGLLENKQQEGQNDRH